MGIFDGLDAEEYDRKYSDRYLAGRIWYYFKPELRRLVFIVVTTILVGGVYALNPIVVSRGVDLLKNDPTGDRMYLIPVAVLTLGVAGWLINWSGRRIIVQAIASVVVRLATDAFKAATNHDLSFYDEYPSGKIVSRITNDTQEFGNLVGFVTDVVGQFLDAAILAVVLVTIDWKLSLYLFAMIPIVFFLSVGYRKLARKVTQAGMRAMANVNSTIKETVSGISIAKNFRQETGIYGDFNGANSTSYNVNIRRGLVLSIVFPVLNTLAGLMTALMVYLGGLSVSTAAVTFGAWYLFLQGLDRFLFPVTNLASFWTNIQNGLSAAERVFALIDAEPAVKQKDNEPVPDLRGEIDFEHVHFSYKTGEKVLEDFTLHINPGENLAFVGHTGAGKSSIAKLIARFYEFQRGSIRVDGRDIRTLNLAQYRQHLGIVSQVPFLFSGSVLENIRYARRTATEVEIEALAKQIGDGEWLETLPLGLKTEVGERGAMLSMGQRQLVALMRVLV
ncbi:MAG: ABC transporter ATP-binding protein, partial [Anaerolineaceae bacterium]|nr:ABC transporter ATP-binding protein [Anaerolineaceae bacterium]